MKKRTTLFIAILLLSSFLSQAQTPTFQLVACNLAGTQNNQIYGVEKDAAGDFYFCGTHSDALQIIFSNLPAGGGGAYWGKVDAFGAVLWMKQGGCSNTSNDKAYDLAIDKNGDLYVCGSLTSFQTPSFNGVALSGPFAGFIAKYTANGNFIWAVGQGAAIYSIAIDQNNIPVVNYGDNTIYKVDPATGNLNMSTSASINGNNQNPFLHNLEIDANNNIICQAGNKIVKLDNNLNQLWSTAISSSLMETFRISLDNSGNVYSTFYALFGTVTIGSITKSNFPNGYLVKLDAATGNPLLVDSILIGGNASKIKVVIPDNAGNYYVSGDGAFNTPHLLKLTTAYATVWDKTLSGNAPVNDVEIITNDCMFIGGKHSGTSMFDAYTIALPSGSSGIDNSYFAALCSGNVGVEENEITSEIQVFPNPGTGLVHFGNKEVRNLLVTDGMGKIIYTSASLTSELDVQQLFPGLYFLNGMTTEGTPFHLRFIKQ